MEILVKTLTRHRDPLSKYWMKDWTAGDIVNIVPDGTYTQNKHNGAKTMGIVLRVNGKVPEDYYKYEPTQFNDFSIDEYGRSKYVVDLASILTDVQLKNCFNHDYYVNLIVLKQSYLDLLKPRESRTSLLAYDKSGSFDNETIDVGPNGHADANTFLEFESNVAISAGEVIGLADEDFDETTRITIAGTGAVVGKPVTFRCTGAGKHDGKEDATAARLILSHTSYVMLFQDDYINVDGLQLINTNSSSGAGVIFQHGGIANLSDCIIRGSNPSSGGIGMALVADADAVTNIWNNVLYDFYRGIRHSFANSGQVMAIYNNTIADLVNAGIIISDSAGDVALYLKNNIVFNTSDDYNLSTFTLRNYTNNCGEDNDSGSQDNYVQTSQAGTDLFTDYTGKDFSIKDVNSDIYEVGISLASDADSKLNISDDIIGTARPQVTNYDIGAFEFVGGAPPVGRPLPQRIFTGPFAGPFGGPF